MMRVLLALATFILIIISIALIKANQTSPPLDEQELEQLYTEQLESLLFSAKEYAAWFRDYELEALHDRFSFEMKLLTPLEDLVEWRDRIAAELGEEMKVIEEALVPSGDNFVYDRISEYSDHESEVQMLITLNDEQLILGFTIQPVSMNESLPEEDL